jgi:hypothetical protein
MLCYRQLGLSKRTYLISSQPHPIHQLLLPSRQTQHIPQCPNLQTIEVLVYSILHQRLQLQHSFFNLEPSFLVHRRTILVLLWHSAFGAVAVREAEQGRVGGEEAGFEGVGATVEDFVYSVNDVVDEGLAKVLVSLELVVRVWRCERRFWDGIVCMFGGAHASASSDEDAVLQGRDVQLGAM